MKAAKVTICAAVLLILASLVAACVSKGVKQGQQQPPSLDELITIDPDADKHAYSRAYNACYNEIRGRHIGNNDYYIGIGNGRFVNARDYCRALATLRTQ